MTDDNVLRPGFHWRGEPIKQVISKDPGGDAKIGVILATSTPAVKFVSNDVNYHNYFAKFQPAGGKLRGVCCIQQYHNKVLSQCGAELSYIQCNLREHIRSYHKDYVPYKVPSYHRLLNQVSKFKSSSINFEL